MAAGVHPTDAPQTVPRLTRPPINRYGRFSEDGREYIITDPRPPRPWSNIISNPRIGLAVSQTGSGFTWIDNSQLGVITRWEQDFARDASGKFLYVRDVDDDRIWSLSPAPVWAPAAIYACRHGLGYTTFECQALGIRARWTLFCHARDTIELWSVSLENLSDRPRTLELTAILEWCCGVAPSPRREFHKLFIETEYDARRGVIFARNHMWDVPNEHHGHWNTDFPYVAGLACTEPIDAAGGDKAAFFGRYGSPANPAALRETSWLPQFGRHEDPIAALRSRITLRPGETRRIGFGLAIDESQTGCAALLEKHVQAPATEAALAEVSADWRARLAEHRVETPDVSVNYLTNDWLRYQAISARIWGRAGYYQQSGAYGFRDQLQDAQIWLTIDPQECRKQIEMHAAHQFADGSVYHWWHPLSEQGHITAMTDDLLWLGFVAANYVRETGDIAILAMDAPFVDDAKPAPLVEHVLRAFRRVFERTSPRGLPYIGAGDWNDGLSACGLREKGESIWLGHFLAGLLRDWSTLFSLAEGVAETCAVDAAEARRLSEEFKERHEKLVAAINEHGWDGKWYIRATLDDGSKIGSAMNRVGRVFLNAQTWAILNDIAPPDRAKSCHAAICEHLVSEAGALLLAPAFDKPVAEIGYITRYAAGLRENGGVYTHAATWAIAAACKMRDRDLVATLLDAINPAKKDPDRYWAEPYVTPGNVDGPDSPHHGRGGWTWYTGSAAWLARVIHERVLGVRPEWDGLRIDPCLPPGWREARVSRPYRGCTHNISIEIDASLPADALPQVTLNGERVEGNLLPPPAPGEGPREVVVRCR